MYRVFHTTDTDPHLLNVTWVRVPSPLDYSAGRYEINTAISKQSVTASITVWKLMLMPDIGSYTVTVCSNCTCNNTTFVLELFQCDPSALPQPVEQYTTTVMENSAPNGALYLYVLFYGSTETFFYATDWTHNGNDLCTEDSSQDPSTFSCNRTLIGNCTFSANLYIYHPSKKDSGNYTVAAIGGGRASRNATVHIGKLWL